MKRCLVALCLTIFLVGMMRTNAEVIYGNLVGSIYDASGTHSLGWNNDLTLPILRGGIGLAVPFTVPIGLEYRLDSVTLALTFAGGATNLELLLLSDNSGAPGDLLELLAINPVIGTGAPRPATFASTLEPLLSGGETYWLLAQPHDLNTTNRSADTAYDWYVNFDGIQGSLARRFFDFEANSWSPTWEINPAIIPAFRIEGTLVPVPEPSTWALLALGSAAFFATRRRRK